MTCKCHESCHSSSSTAIASSSNNPPSSQSIMLAELPRQPPRFNLSSNQQNTTPQSNQMTPFSVNGKVGNNTWHSNSSHSRTPGQKSISTASIEASRHQWSALHYYTRFYPEHPTEEQKQNAKQFCWLIGANHHCPDCAAHYRLMLRQHPPDVDSRESLFKWGVDRHNAVNLRLKKPLVSLQEAKHFYGF